MIRSHEEEQNADEDATALEKPEDAMVNEAPTEQEGGLGGTQGASETNANAEMPSAQQTGGGEANAEEQATAFGKGGDQLQQNMENTESSATPSTSSSMNPFRSLGSYERIFHRHLL